MKVHGNYEYLWLFKLSKQELQRIINNSLRFIIQIKKNLRNTILRMYKCPRIKVLESEPVKVSMGRVSVS